MILCDIGNSRMHCFDGERVEHLSFEEGLRKYARSDVRYICVNDRAKERLRSDAPGWRELEAEGLLQTGYEGLGADRAAACLGLHHGVVVDAGSAITVDVMEEGRHLGGWIWPGLRSWRACYRAISPRLDLPLDPEVDLYALPLSTREAVSYAVFAPIARLVKEAAGEKPVVVTGGDASTVAPLIEGAVIDEQIVFRGMEKIIMTKESHC
ncbi:type III pantothenate kinase [Hydrogenimonas sp. SS33]|uniref:type III pantothenate kinase n=1 Tax=Hydrogenimonas leucolamina TaxID=2954236 RepID=UPI00336BB2CB